MWQWLGSLSLTLLLLLLLLRWKCCPFLIYFKTMPREAAKAFRDYSILNSQRHKRRLLSEIQLVTILIQSSIVVKDTKGRIALSFLTIRYDTWCSYEVANYQIKFVDSPISNQTKPNPIYKLYYFSHVPLKNNNVSIAYNQFHNLLIYIIISSI